MNPLLLRQRLQSFLMEDVGTGDLSSQWIYPSVDAAVGYFLAKQDGMICGQTIAQAAYDLLGHAVYEPLIGEGQKVTAGTRIGRASGEVRTLLTAERVILNLIQRMSGIATQTSEAVRLLADPTIKITDTRKTVPGLRLFDKYAVTVGGGHNHRIGLYDGVMLKDNHIAASGGITAAVRTIRTHLGPMVKIEVETETEAEVREAVAAGADVIMFDNQAPATIRSWRRLVPAAIATEASGGITRRSLPYYTGCGVDYLSLGYLTNAAIPLDISFDLERSKS